LHGFIVHHGLSLFIVDHGLNKLIKHSFIIFIYVSGTWT